MIDPTPLVALRLALALLFAGAAWHKLRAFAAFREALAEYRLLPASTVAAAAGVVVACEGVVAVSLLAVPARGALLAAGLLALYTGAIGWNLLRGRREIECGCGGPALRQTLSGALVVRNLALVAAALACGAEPSSRALVWVDALSIGGAAAVLALLYAATNRLIANAPQLALLRSTP